MIYRWGTPILCLINAIYALAVHDWKTATAWLVAASGWAFRALERTARLAR